MKNETSQHTISFRKKFIWLGIICTVVIASIAILGWLYGFGDVWTFRSELSQQISKMPKGGVRIPTQEPFGRIFVQATLNGKRRINMYVDTGCGMCMIDRSLANELRLGLRGKTSVVLPDESCKLQEAIIPELKIGSLILHSVPVVIKDMDIISMSNGGEQDGVLGNSLLREFATTFDSKHKVIVFQANDKLQIPLTASKIHCLPNCWVPNATGSWNGNVKQPVIIDTGADSSLLSYSISKQLGLRVMPTGTLGYSSGVAHKGGLVKVPEFCLDKFKVSNMTFVVDLSKVGAENWPTSLGTDFLDKYCFTLDQNNNVLFLEPYATISSDSERDIIYLMVASKWSEALKKLNKTILLEPQNIDLRVLRVRNLYQLKMYDRCVAETTLGIRMCSTEREFYYERALAYEKLGDHKAAIEDILHVASMFSTDPFVQWICGDQLIQISAQQQAIVPLSQALKLSPNLKEAYILRSQAYEKLREYKMALEDCDSAIVLDPHQVRYLTDRAWVRNASDKDFDKSIEDCNEALRIDPNFAAAYRNRAVALIGKNNYLDAMVDLNKSLTLDSASERAGKTYYLRSSVYTKLGNKLLAEQDEKKSKLLGYNANED